MQPSLQSQAQQSTILLNLGSHDCMQNIYNNLAHSPWPMCCAILNTYALSSWTAHVNVVFPFQASIGPCVSKHGLNMAPDKPACCCINVEAECKNLSLRTTGLE